MRKNQQRQLEALQNTIDSEQKAKAEGLKIRKKHDIDMAELESRLDMSERNAADYLKTIKKLQSQIKVRKEMFTGVLIYGHLKTGTQYSVIKL